MWTVSRVSSLKVLDVTISSQMSVSEHVSTVISSCQIHICPQDSPVTWHEQRSTSYDLHICYQSQTVIRCQCNSAWWGFTTATDRQRLEALIKRFQWHTQSHGLSATAQLLVFLKVFWFNEVYVDQIRTRRHVNIWLQPKKHLTSAPLRMRGWLDNLAPKGFRSLFFCQSSQSLFLG